MSDDAAIANLISDIGPTIERAMRPSPVRRLPISSPLRSFDQSTRTSST